MSGSGRHARSSSGPWGAGPVRRAGGGVVAVWIALTLVAAVTRGDAEPPGPETVVADGAAWSVGLSDAVSTVVAESAAVAEPEPAADPVTLDVPQPPPPPPVPADSGAGRRIVFSEGQQRVWLVADGEVVERTYLVSGSRFDNLQPGTYAVQSRSQTATSFDYTGTMEYFVGFTTGWSAPIGFHSIPVYHDGTPEQTVEQLGLPLSAGCVRQDLPDAVALWDFAPLGTTVVVTA